MGEFEELDLLELMLPQNAARVFAGSTGFRAKASSPGSHMDGQLFLGDGFVAVEIVQFDLRSGRQPEICVLKLEKIRREFRQLSRAQERRGIHNEWRKNFRIAMLARVDIQKKIRQSALKPRTPAFVNGKARSGNLCGGRKVKNAGPLSDFPVRLQREIKLGRRTPAPDLHVVLRAPAHGYAEMGDVGHGEEEFALPGIQLRD